MSQPQEPGEAQAGPLQFDRAEFAEEPPGGPYCRVCREPLRDVYYDVGGNVVCPSCLEKHARPGSRLGRGLKALLYGSVAAAVGAAIYRMILFGTGWNFSLVAILVGYMVGGAVKTGSGERGGRIYQLLAVFLTYSALVGMFLPDVWKALAAGPKAAREHGKAVEKGPRDGVKADPVRKADTKPAEDAARPRAEARPAAAVAEPAPEVKAEPGPAAPKPKRDPMISQGAGVHGVCFICSTCSACSC